MAQAGALLAAYRFHRGRAACRRMNGDPKGAALDLATAFDFFQSYVEFCHGHQSPN